MTSLVPPKSAGLKVVLAIWFVIWLPVIIFLVNLTGYDSLVSAIWSVWWTGLTLGIALGVAEVITARRFNLRDRIVSMFSFAGGPFHR